MYQFSYPIHYFVLDLLQILGRSTCHSYFSRNDRLAVSYYDLAPESELFALEIYPYGDDLSLCNGSDERNACFSLADLTVL